MNGENTFELTKEQLKCVDVVAKSYKIQQIITIGGYSGTGKSTIISAIINKLNFNPEEIVYATYTGKAALVLRRKNLPAITIHKLIYNCYKNQKTGEFTFIKKKELDEYPFCRMIVIDEISMVGKKLLEDLLSFNIPILCLGDPFQLEPVKDLENNLLSSPDFLLTEIHRQKNKNSIVDFSFDLRTRATLKSSYNDENIRTILKDNISIGMLLWADQILCSTNKIRKYLNDEIRKAKDFEGVLPQVGDKLICNKNYHEILSNKNQESLVNGTIGYITNILNTSNKGLFDNYMDIEFRPEWDKEDYYLIRIDLNPFLGYAPYNDTNNKRYGKFSAKKRIDVDFGYAITVHKSQGSEWDNVLVYSCDAFGDKHRLLYTAITRAKEKLIYIQ